MGIDLYWEDEEGNVLSSVDDPKFIFARFLATAQLSNTTCLRFIDQYGDTIFNQLQTPVLISELEKNLEFVPTLDVAEHIEKILLLARRSNGEIHTYLKFYGD